MVFKVKKIREMIFYKYSFNFLKLKSYRNECIFEIEINLFLFIKFEFLE